MKEIKMKVLMLTQTSVTIEFENNTCFFNQPYTLNINDAVYRENEHKNITTIFGLSPKMEYQITAYFHDIGEKYTIHIITLDESKCLSVKDFGATGDGSTEDTSFIQAAIMACPKNGRVLIPKGEYLIRPIFLKSDITIEIEKDASLKGIADRNLYPILPGTIKEDSMEASDYLGTWEGDPDVTYASLLTGIGITNTNIIGEGIIDGCGQYGDWWIDAKTKKGAWRPRILFLAHCQHVQIQGLTFKNSPSWTIHPYFSNNLQFIDLMIENPKDSPNTDGLNPESCKDVNILGVDFSVGDDCIAIKSGKIYMGKRFKCPSERIIVRNCRMRFGHGAVVLGSEMAGGIKEIFVSQCIFEATDRGLRIKTRRGRGKDAVIDQITFRDILMKRVKTPLVMNMYYFCDPDGKTEYVWSKEALPVDERTPKLGDFTFQRIHCTEAEVAAGFFFGLPEQPIEKVILEDVHIEMTSDGEADYPDMLSHIQPVAQSGFYMKYVKQIETKNLVVLGAKDEPYQFEQYELWNRQ